MRGFFAIAALALGACYALDEGRQQSWTKQTPLSSPDVAQRANAHLRRAGYQVLHSDDRLTEAEKQRDGGRFDVLRVIVEGAGGDGTRVRVQAVTEEGSAGGRKESRSASSTALTDGQALVDALTTAGGL